MKIYFNETCPKCESKAEAEEEEDSLAGVNNKLKEHYA